MTAKKILTTFTYVSIALSLPTITLIPREINAGKDANLFLDTYGPTGCIGISNGGAEAIYHENNTSLFTFIAYSLDRDLEPTEQLDFPVLVVRHSLRLRLTRKRKDATHWKPMLPVGDFGIMVALDGPVTERPADIASGYSRAPCLAGACGFYVV